MYTCREICRFHELQNDKHPIVDCLLLLDGAENPKGLDDSYTSIVHVSPNVMKKLSGMQSVDSIEGIALMRIPKSFYDMDDVNQEEEIHWSCFHSPQRILVLDGIQVPNICCFYWRNATKQALFVEHFLIIFLKQLALLQRNTP